MVKTISNKRKGSLFLNMGVREQLAGYAFMLPGFLFIAIFMGYPLLDSLYLSFTKFNFSTDSVPVFNGITNYIKLFQDSYFIDSFRNTMVFTVAFFPLVMVISLILALLLDNGVKGSGLFRTSIFLPVVVPLSLTGIVFQWILNDQYGLFNYLLRYVFNMGWAAKDWLGDGTWAMVSIIVVSLWKNIGLLVIMFMAGLQAISNDIIEASRVDGANTMQRVFHVILPNLRGTFIVCGLWAILQAIKVFEQPFVMTNGGPGTATLVLYQYTWMNAFKYFDMGYASAIAYFMCAIILILIGINTYLNRNKDEKAR